MGLTIAHGQQAAPPEPISTSVTVAARVEAKAPASVTSLSKEWLERSPGVNMDDRIRLVPGFTLFRRSSSIAANPTTQGVSLRGVGPTGASRTLVLWDGIPANDPFGGWVYWTRLVPEEIERVEISRGASTSLFGDRAMGGAIGLFSREAERTRGSFSFESGNKATAQASASAAGRIGRWGVSGSGRSFTTDGYFVVPERARGEVDTMGGVRFAGGVVRADRVTQADRLFLRADVLVEERENGTRLQRNSTSLGTAAAHYSRTDGDGLFSALAFHTRTEYRASFSSIAADRNSERLTSRQSVPADAWGGAILYRRAGAVWNMTGGADLNRAEGYSLDTLFPAGVRSGGGVQWQHGLFVQGDVQVRSTQLFGGLRRHMAGAREFWSPSAGVAHAVGRLRLRASGYRAFRAPTLNELYREFRAGNARTLPNDALRPEAMTGVEAGAEFRTERNTLSATVFHNKFGGLITNVTRSVAPSLITRQRDNAAAAVSRGVEAAFTHRRGAWTGEASWLWVESTFSQRLRVPQTPRNQGSASATWRRGRGMVSGGVRASSLQFEDDLNMFVLQGFAAWHFAASVQLNKAVSANVAMENAFDREIPAGFTPAPMTGPPRLVRVGLRYNIN